MNSSTPGESITIRDYDSSIGVGFPYNIPRRAAPPPLTRPRDKVTSYRPYQGDYDVGNPVWKEQNNSLTNKDEVVTQGKKVSKEIKSFSLRPPPTRTGRVIYKILDIPKTGYGFGEERFFEVSNVTRLECRVLKRQLLAWMRETKYRPCFGELRGLKKALPAYFIGFIGGSILSYSAFQYTQTFQKIPYRLRLGFSITGGLLGGYLLRYWVIPAGYIDLLQKNSPLGYKARQFLYEHRQRNKNI